MRRLAPLAVLTALLVAPLGCKSEGAGRAEDGAVIAPDAAAGLRGDWRVTAIRGEPLAEGHAGRAPTMTITDEGRVGGSAGINRWSSTLDVGGLTSGRFSLGPTVTTLMAGPPEAMELEEGFIAALREVNCFDPGALGGGELRLLGADGEERLRLERPG